MLVIIINVKVIWIYYWHIISFNYITTVNGSEAVAVSQPHNDCGIKMASIPEIYKLMVEGHFLYCHGAGTTIKQNCSASKTSQKFLGCCHNVKIEAMIVPINTLKCYVQDDYSSIFQKLPNSKLKCKITVFEKNIFMMSTGCCM